MEKKKRGRQPKVTDNTTVAKWLIEHKWMNLDKDIKHKLPEFVDDAVYGALYICGEISNGKLNVSTENIYRCLMLTEISTTEVESLMIGLGHSYSERTLRRITQVARFAAKGIESKISQYEETHKPSEIDIMNWRIESRFVWDYYHNQPSEYHSHQIPVAPNEILQLYRDRKYLEYGEALRTFRRSYLRSDKY